MTDMKTEYKIRDMKVLGVGEHFKKMAAKQGYVQLAPDVAKVFADAESVNNALRKLIEAMPQQPAKRKKSA